MPSRSALIFSRKPRIWSIVSRLGRSRACTRPTSWDRTAPTKGPLHVHQAQKAFAELLSSRQFPIGKEEQIKAWQQKDHMQSVRCSVGT